MDIVNYNAADSKLSPGVGGKPRSVARSVDRLHYHAQVNVIRGQIGGLEAFRIRLGLSQRKMAQLLLVDPSAWTRWIQKAEEAPPHIWRALQWYASLAEKIPGLTPQYFLGGDSKKLQLEIEKRVDLKIRTQIEEQNHFLNSSLTHSAKDIDLLQRELMRLGKINDSLKLSVIILALGFVLGIAVVSLLLFLRVRI